METQMTDESTPKPETTYDLTLKGAGLTIERKVTEAVALSVIATVMGADAGRVPQPRNLGVAGARAGVGGAPALTAGEYLSSVEPKRNPDKILAFGAYLTDEMGRETFTRDEVRSMFQSAAEPVPGNFHRDFTWAVANRWLGEQPGTPGAFYVTTTGRTALKNKFAAEIKTATKLRPRRRRKASAGAEAEADADAR
jgi:hypothetical protein